VIVTTYIAGQSSEPAVFTYAATNPVIPPPILTITDVGISTVNLSWAPATAAFEPVSYNILATSGTGVSRNFVDISDTQVACEDLTSGALYNLSLYTVYKGIQSANAIDVNVKTIVGSPRNLDFTQCNATSVELIWDSSPAQIPGQDVVYNISGNNVADPADYFYETTSNNAIAYLLDGIIMPGAQYDVYISAVYDMSESAPAFISVFTGTAPPTNFKAEAKDLTTDTISLTWNASITPGVTYRVYIDGEPIELDNVLQYDATGLGPGTSHDFYVVAVSATGVSAPTPTLTAYTYIAPPINLSNIPTDGNPEYALKFGWQSIDPTSYELTLSGGGSNTVAGTPELTYEFAGLFSGEKYDAFIRSVQADLCSYSVDFANPFYTVVAPVENLSANPAGGAAGSTSIVLNWSLSPADYGGPSDTKYDIYVDSAPRATIGGGTNTFSLINLTPETSYTLGVRTRQAKFSVYPPLTSSIVSVTASTNPRTYPTMTFNSNSTIFAYAPDTVGYGIILASGSLLITDLSGGDIWFVTPPDGGLLSALGVLPAFNGLRGLSYNPLATETPLLVAHADGVTSVSKDGHTVNTVTGSYGGGWGITSDSIGNTYVSIPSTQIIQYVDPTANFVSDYVTNLGSNPEGIALADNGTIYAADSVLNAVTFVTPDRNVGTLTTIPGSANPSAIVYSVDGNLYVADRGNRKIFKVTLAGSVSEFTTLPLGYTPLAMTQNPTTGNLYTTHPNGTVTEIQVTLT
jgi:hypothetical protein